VPRADRPYRTVEEWTTAPRRLQRHLTIVHNLPGLPGDVAERYNLVVLVDRARSGGVHEPGTSGDHRGVGIRDSIGQAAGPDQFDRHGADDATSADRYTTEFTAPPADAIAALTSSADLDEGTFPPDGRRTR
jgi:hypothetical protein